LSSLLTFFSSKKNEEGIEYISCFQRLYARMAGNQRSKSNSIELEIDLIQNFNRLVEIRYGITFSDPEKLTPPEAASEIKIPSFLLVKVVSLVNLVPKSSASAKDPYRISIATIGGILQFTVELNGHEELRFLDTDQRNAYIQLRDLIGLQVSNWNQVESNMVEFSEPLLEDGIFLTRLFHVRITL